MLLVLVTYNPNFREVDELGIACGEIVPAALSSARTHFRPRSNLFIPSQLPANGRMNVDVLLEIRVTDEGRPGILTEAQGWIQAALRNLFPGVTFGIFMQAPQGVWVSDAPDLPWAENTPVALAYGRAANAIEQYYREQAVR